MSLNYEPAQLQTIRKHSSWPNSLTREEKTVLFVSTGKDMEDSTGQYAETNRLLAQMRRRRKNKRLRLPCPQSF